MIDHCLKYTQEERGEIPHFHFQSPDTKTEYFPSDPTEVKSEIKTGKCEFNMEISLEEAPVNSGMF